MAEPLILINAFEVPGEEADQFVAAWEKTRDYLITQPGDVDTALHQAIAPGAKRRGSQHGPVQACGLKPTAGAAREAWFPRPVIGAAAPYPG